MAINPNPSKLDATQISQRTFDADNDAIRTSLGSTSFAVALDAADGDNIAVKGLSTTTKVSLTDASTGVVLAAADCAGHKTFQLFAKTTATITGAQVCTLEVSPSDSEDVWFATSATLTPSGTADAVVASSAISAAGRRARVSIAAAISSGTFDLFLVKQGV